MSIHELPLPGFDRLDCSVATARARWTETLRIINEARRTTTGQDLLQGLDNLQYMAKQALNQLNRTSSPMEPALGTPGLEVAKVAFLKELPRVQLLCSQAGLGDDAALTQSLLDLSKPKTTSDLFLGVLLAGGLLLAVYAVKG